MLILSIFPGIDLLGRGFEAEGFCVVRGPDKIWGGDIYDFHPPYGAFEGTIGGSPCQDFSRARRAAPSGDGVKLLAQFARVVTESQPAWFLLENVPAVPDISAEGYTVQRLDLNARECGSAQNRHRHFQFGTRTGLVLVPERILYNPLPVAPTAMATEGGKAHRRSWADFCELQGLPRDFHLEMSRTQAYKAVGNGVPIPMARVIARAIKAAYTRTEAIRICICGCGRIVDTNRQAATPACRKRLERRRNRDASSRQTLSTVTALDADGAGGSGDAS